MCVSLVEELPFQVDGQGTNVQVSLLDAQTCNFEQTVCVHALVVVVTKSYPKYTLSLVTTPSNQREPSLLSSDNRQDLLDSNTSRNESTL